MILSLFVQDANAAGIRREKTGDETFWLEMEAVLWFLIRIPGAFSDSRPRLPETLAECYLDTEFLLKYVENGRPAAGMEGRNAGRADSAAQRAILSGIVRRPVYLIPEGGKETVKYIRASYPECRLAYGGFGRFLGYSDLNRMLFWAPFLVLRFFYLLYHPYGEEISAILAGLARTAGTAYARREITADNPQRLAREGIRRLRRPFQEDK